MTTLDNLHKMVKVLGEAEEKLGRAMGRNDTTEDAEVYAIYDEMCQLQAKCWNLRAGRLREARVAVERGMEKARVVITATRITSEV